MHFNDSSLIFVIDIFIYLYVHTDLENTGISELKSAGFCLCSLADVNKDRTSTNHLVRQAKTF